MLYTVVCFCRFGIYVLFFLYFDICCVGATSTYCNFKGIETIINCTSDQDVDPDLFGDGEVQALRATCLLVVVVVVGVSQMVGTLPASTQIQDRVRSRGQARCLHLVGMPLLQNLPTSWGHLRKKQNLLSGLVSNLPCDAASHRNLTASGRNMTASRRNLIEFIAPVSDSVDTPLTKKQKLCYLLSP